MSKTVKKISSLSAIILVIASTVGAGIFFKNKDLSMLAQGELGFVLASWGVAIFGLLALGLALIELSSAQKTNAGALEWAKIFNPRWFYLAANRYNKWFFVPSTMFAIPIYISSTFVDAGWNLTNGYLVLLLSFVIFMFFMVLNLLSHKAAEYGQWVSKGLQLIPLIVMPIIAMANSGNVEGLSKVNESTGLSGASKWMIIIAGIPAITFAFDGFYTVASIQEDLKHPEHSGSIMIIGVLLISVIYGFVTAGFIVGSVDGSLFGIPVLEKKEWKWAMSLFNVLIACGMMGIVNGYALGSPRQFASLQKDGEMPESSLIQKMLIKLFPGLKNKSEDRQAYLSGWVYLLSISLLFYLILGPIGISGYKEGWDAELYGAGVFGADSLYGFVDILTNFTSICFFVIMATSIIGGLINRRTNKVEVKKKKYFVPTAIIAVVWMYAAFIYMVIATIVDMTGYNGADPASAAIRFSIFAAMITISVIPSIIETLIKKSKPNKKTAALVSENKVE